MDQLAEEAIRRHRQRALLLHHLDRAPNGKLSRAAANGKIAKPLQAELSLPPAVADELREGLVGDGLLAKSVFRGRPSYSITDAGRAALGKLRQYIPLQPVRGSVKSPAQPFTRASQRAFVLLQLAATEGGETATNLNKKPGPEKLGLTAATARFVRAELLVRGLIAVERTARAEKFSLTPAGAAELVATSFEEFAKLELSGPLFTKLLRVARGPVESGRAAQHVDVTDVAVQRSTAPDIRQAVLDAYAELRRERHALTGRVPIHEVRDAIRRRFGPSAASHDALDPAILALWREKRFRLNPIVDLGRATHEQLQDSIAGVGETLFHLEAST